MTGSRSLTFSTTRRPARRRWVRVAVALLVVAVVAAVVIAVSGGLLWAYAWSQLGGDQLPSLAATGEDAPGSGDATAPTGTTTVLVALTQMPADATDVPPLAGPVALVQVGGPRQDEATVVLLPPELPVSVEGAAPMPLRDVHAAGGADVLLRSVVDYTGVAVDHVVVADRGVLPELVATTGPVEVCRPTCTIVDRASVEASVEAFTAEGTAPVEAADAMVELSGVVRALGAATDPFSAISSPLATRRAIDVIGSRVTTDANLRGAALLPLAEHIGGAGEVSIVTLPGVVNPDTGELLILPEQAETRFALLREGGAPTPSSADDEAALLAQATVSVQNGTGTAGYAASLETRLTALGVRVVGTENATDFDHDTTKVVHAAGDPTAEATAILLARELGDVELVASEEVPSFEGEPVTLQVIGGTDLDDGTDDGES